MKEIKDPGLKVLGARCVVLEDKLEEKTSSGIVIPGREKEPTFRGTVVAVGDGALLETGVRVTVEEQGIKVGDRVIYTNFSGSPILTNNETFVVLNCRDIIAIITD